MIPSSLVWNENDRHLPPNPDWVVWQGKWFPDRLMSQPDMKEFVQPDKFYWLRCRWTDGTNRPAFGPIGPFGTEALAIANAILHFSNNQWSKS